MNRNQRTLVVITLCVFALFLGLTFLTWSYGDNSNAAAFIVFHIAKNVSYPDMSDFWGIYTLYGLTGYLLGLYAPATLLATASFFALGGKSPQQSAAS